MIFITSDTHFGDESIRRYENRPFSSVREMDEELIRRWNEKVSDEDVVWHLGDFCVPGKEEEYLKRLHGKVILVRGNHDELSNEQYRRAGFQEVYDLPVLYEGFWILSHEPLYVNENMPYANLFGHVHGSKQYVNFSSQHYVVCVERSGYAPIAFEDVKKTIVAQTKECYNEAIKDNAKRMEEE